MIEKGKIGIKAAIPCEFPLVTTGEQRATHNEFHFEGEAVCIPLVSATGHGHASIKRLHYESGKFCAGSILAACLPKDPKKTSAKFLYLYLSLLKDSILVPLMQGSANVSLKIKDIEKVEVPDVSLQEQNRLVKLIDKLKHKQDKILDEIGKQQSYLQHLRQTILQEAVQGKLTQQNPNDEPASELLKRIKAEKQKLIKEGKLKKEKELPPITKNEIPFGLPEGWVWCRMNDISYVGNGSTPDKSQFTSSPDDIPYLKVYNIVKQQVDFDYKPQYVKRDCHYGQLKRSVVYAGDVLMNIVGPPLGKVALVPDSLPECNINQAIVVIRPFLKELNRWIYWFLREQSAINSIVTKGTAGQDNISVTQSRNLLVPFPPLPEQTRIVHKIEKLTNHITQLEQQVTTSQTQAQQLLQTVLAKAFEAKEKLYPVNEALSLAAEE